MEKRLRVILAAWVGASLCLATKGTAGDLDLSFGTGGRVITTFPGGTQSASAVVIQPDGKIVAIGTATGFALARYDVTGTLDVTFGTGGLVTTDIGPSGEAFAAALQPDGKIVAAGRVAPAGYCCQFALARYDSNGSLDTSFGTGGLVITNIGGLNGASALAIQSDNKIVAAGSTGAALSEDFALARYNADGSLDPTFGTGGQVTTDFGGIDQPGDVAIRPDGKILVVGGGGPAHDFCLVLYGSNGMLETSFGAGGKVTTDFGGLDRAHAVRLQSDGKMVLAGTGAERFALARYDAQGGLDPTFGGNGKVTIQFTGDNIEAATDVAIQADGKIVASGWAFASFTQEFALARFEADGRPDVSLGDLGRVLTSFAGGDAAAGAMALQADGKIVTAGGGGPCTPHCEFTLARYLRLPTADLSCSNTDGVAAKIAGETVTYKIAIANSEPNAVVGAIVTDLLPPSISGATWQCALTGGGSCAPSGTGSINDSLTLLVGATATYTVTGTIDISATGTLVNTAAVAAPPGVTDLNAADNAATDTDVLVPAADLAISKTDGQARVEAGAPITYTITASNSGPRPVAAARVTDNVPSDITAVTWSCVATGGATCAGSGSGSIDDTANLPVGGALTYTLTGVVSPSAASPVTNTATVLVPPGLGVGDPYPANNNATDRDLLAGADYYTVAPCRIVDTRRSPDGPLAGPALVAGAARIFSIAGNCGIPLSASAVSVNVTITQATHAGDLRLYPAGAAAPLVSSLNWSPGQTRANSAVVKLSGEGLSVQCDQATGMAHLILDVNGYYSR